MEHFVVCQGRDHLLYESVAPPLTEAKETTSILSEGQVIFVALVKLRDNESFEQAFRRFKKQCEKSGILSEVKKREHYEKPSVRLKKKSLSARKRLIKKLKKQQHD